MARYTGPKSKISRKYGEPIFGDTKALEKKPHPPGQHGNSRRRKLSNYGIQLREKQRIKYMYGLLEKQFRNYFKKSQKKDGPTGHNLLIMLESRLDNTIFRLGFISATWWSPFKTLKSFKNAKKENSVEGQIVSKNEGNLKIINTNL